MRLDRPALIRLKLISSKSRGLRGQFSGVDGMAVDGFVTDRSSHNGSHYTR